MKSLKNCINSSKKATKYEVFVPYLKQYYVHTVRTQIMHVKGALLNMTHMRPLFAHFKLFFKPSLENFSKKCCSYLIPMTFYGEIKSNESFVLANDFPLQKQQWVAQCGNCRNLLLTHFITKIP